MTHSRRSSEAPSTEAPADVDTAAEAGAGGGGTEPVEAAGSDAGGKHARSGSGKHAAPEKVHGDPLSEAVQGGGDTETAGATGDKGVAGGTAETGGAAQAGSAGQGGGTAQSGAELGALRTELDERTRDLQRLSAEYANYRKRVARDSANARNEGVADVLGVLLPVLDDLDRAREHGDLTGPFGAVADQLAAALTKFGLTPFGAKGDAFDPNRHEAVAHRTSDEVTEPSCVSVMRRGYLLGERLLRPAMVEVADPE